MTGHTHARCSFQTCRDTCLAFGLKALKESKKPHIHVIAWMFSTGTQLESWIAIIYCHIFKQIQDREFPVNYVSRILLIKITVNAVQAQDCSTVLGRASSKELPALAMYWYKTNHVGCQEFHGAHIRFKCNFSMPAVFLAGVGSSKVLQWLARTFSQSTWQVSPSLTCS